MTPHDLKTARKTLGLSAAALGRRLELEGDDPGRSVRLWEAGRRIPGPVRVAVGYMLAEQARQGLQDAVQQAQAILTPQPTAVVFSDPSGPDMRPLHMRTRRRG